MALIWHSRATARWWLGVLAPPTLVGAPQSIVPSSLTNVVAIAGVGLFIKLNANNSIPPCPAGGTYNYATVGINPTCTLSTTVIPSHVLA